MANVFIEERTLTAIGNAIRAKTNTTDLILPKDMPSAMDALSLAGADYNDGYEDGYEKGLSDIEQAKYDAFWDFYQNNGNREEYERAFSGGGNATTLQWNDTTFKPKYDLTVKGGAARMFADCRITDLKGILEERGLTLDLSGATGTSQIFMWSTITRLPTIDFSSAPEVHFYYAYLLKSVDKVVLKQDGSQTSYFQGCGALEDITFEGVIGQNLGMGECKKLKRASIENIFSVLSTTATGKTATFSKTAKEAAFTTDEWEALKATKPNWTIALA